MNKCYMCDAEGTTREHVPPDSFFPKGYRDNLVTVPSCDEHNTKNSKDVEYVRNVIVVHISTNNAARSHFQDKVLRSFRNSLKLFNRTFKDVKPIIFNGKETGIFTVDINRFNQVMESIAYAVYYKSFDRSYAGYWDIFASSFILNEALFQDKRDDTIEYRQLLRQLSFTDEPSSQPRVFRYAVNMLDEEQFVYRFVFYEGVIIYARAVSPRIEGA
jgi:hypothetical protein